MLSIMCPTNFIVLRFSSVIYITSWHKLYFLIRLISCWWASESCHWQLFAIIRLMAGYNTCVLLAALHLLLSVKCDHAWSWPIMLRTVFMAGHIVPSARCCNLVHGHGFIEQDASAADGDRHIPHSSFVDVCESPLWDDHMHAPVAYINRQQILGTEMCRIMKMLLYSCLQAWRAHRHTSLLKTRVIYQHADHRCWADFLTLAKDHASLLPPAEMIMSNYTLKPMSCKPLQSYFQGHGCIGSCETGSHVRQSWKYW